MSKWKPNEIFRSHIFSEFYLSVFRALFDEEEKKAHFSVEEFHFARTLFSTSH